MCGITGTVRWKGPTQRPNEIERMTRAISHRGPDGEGVFIRDGVALGNRRLAIIDLESGQQPMCNEDGMIWVTYNGEIYNYLDLRRDLQQKGHTFATQSDTEVIVHAYEEWGPECVKRFRGMFAFAVADFKIRKVLLARDHFGIKPLFYRIDQGYLAFASELNALRAVDDEPPLGNLEAVELYLRYQYIPAPHTVYQSVFKLPPASYLLVDFDGDIDGPQKYWDLSFKSEAGVSDEEWKERAEEVIHESVKAHLVSDVPFGVFLSGGIDSSLVALQMSRILQRPIKAFAIGFDEAEYSELAQAAEAARRCGIDLYTDVIRSDALKILPDLVSHYGEPFGDSSAIPTWYVSRLAREHVPMVLSGDGGDEAFGGYNTYAGWMEADPSTRPFQPSLLHPRSVLHWGQLAVRRFVVNRAKRRLADWHNIVLYAGKEYRRSLWRPEYQRLVDQSCQAFDDAARRAQPLDRLAYAQYLDYQTYLPCDILAKVDVASMYHGLEVRTPLVDRRVLELASALPLAQRFRRNGSGEGIGKYLTKQVTEKNFPPEFVHRRKRGFSIPRASWFLPGQLGRDLLEQVLVNKSSQIYEWFNPEQVRAEIVAHNKEHDNSATLWLLLVLSLWVEQNPQITF